MHNILSIILNILHVTSVPDEYTSVYLIYYVYKNMFSISSISCEFVSYIEVK